MMGMPRVNIARMKTTNLKTYKEQVVAMENQEGQIAKSKNDITQFNQIKSVLLNFSFNNAGAKTLCVDIIESVMDELRRERKIRMVLADAEIEEYIKLDLTGKNEDEEGINPYLKQILQEKRLFKEALCQKVSIIRLGYMYTVLKAVHPGKASMLGAEAFNVKVHKVESRMQKRREQFAEGKDTMVNSSQGGSQDSITLKKGAAADSIVDPVLHGINTFV